MYPLKVAKKLWEGYIFIVENLFAFNETILQIITQIYYRKC